ncbi:MAG: hypothetical protein AVDCRST_MAG96-287 [uncultured Segetibacter sp.]|uniref:Uncharacterized protein n=1 Tax=uncultured Segetibacter sp. TaxID=481133 RepID=A0A6J4RBA1_9BACT|nr:MAG: hypothetical protein AVDCRST_MAG96-287 [uncultured Segetibacter sp.]
MIASIFALEKRLELFMTSDINPTTKDRYQIERIVSYDSGETWVDNWIRNEIGTFSSGAAASIAGDSLDIFLVGKMKYLYFFLSLLVIASATPAQFSSDATSPMVVCNATNGQGKVKAMNDSITTTGGYFVFWLDRRAGGASNGHVYGQRLDPDGNMLWENQGRPIVATNNVSDLAVVPWQQGFLLSYVSKNQDSIMCMYLDSNGHNL